MAKRFLIVGDSVPMRQLVSLTVKDAGYDVLAAENGADAFAQLKGGRIDLVIADMNMPDKDDILFIRNLRGTPEYRFVPIVMLTRESQEAKRQEGRAAGASGWIETPFLPGKLLEVVRKFVR